MARQHRAPGRGCRLIVSFEGAFAIEEAQPSRRSAASMPENRVRQQLVSMNLQATGPLSPQAAPSPAPKPLRAGHLPLRQEKRPPRKGGLLCLIRPVWKPNHLRLIHWTNRFAARTGDYFLISDTTPAPTVRPPSRMAKRRPLSMAIGLISSTSIFTLSPGRTISLSAGSFTMPVTSVVRK